jgi:uncharacterized protein (TIGR00725 family)
MGAGDRPTTDSLDRALELGARVAAEGWVLLTGGRAAGVMEAASQGAHEAGGIVVGVLPDPDTTRVSRHVDIAICTDMGNARNNINVLTSDVVIVCGDLGAGTFSEAALAVKAGRPLILLSRDEEACQLVERLGGDLVSRASDPQDAIDRARALVAPRADRTGRTD